MKKKQVLNRKRLALRRLVTAAVLMVLINHFFLLGSIFPRQCIWNLEERKGVRHTSVVARDWTPEIHKTHLVYLTENEETTLFGSTYLSLYGWFEGFSVALDCSEEAPLYAGRSYMGRDDRNVWYFFGRVDDPAIETVEISLRSQEWNEAAQAPLYREIRRLVAEDFLEKDGRRYFLLRDSGEWDSGFGSSPRPVAIGYDGAGGEVARVDIEQGISSYFG